jgi:hypothetical protein
VLFLFDQDYFRFENIKTLPIFTLVCAFRTDTAGSLVVAVRIANKSFTKTASYHGDFTVALYSCSSLKFIPVNSVLRGSSERTSLQAESV